MTKKIDMVAGKGKRILVLFFALTLILLGFASACQEQPICGNGIKETGEECDWGTSNGFLCWAGYGSSCTYCTSTCKLKTITNYCGDGIKQECEQCDDGNVISGDGCSDTCKIEQVLPICGNGILETGEQCDDRNLINGDGCSSVCEIEETPTCDHDIAVRYSYSNSFGMGIAVAENGTWINGNPANLSEGDYKIKYFIDNKKEADDNVHIIVKIDNNNLIPEYNYEINSYHSKEISLNTSQFCGLHTISVNVTSDGDECNLSDNYAEREIYVECDIPPEPPVCGNSLIEAGEQCDDGNIVNNDGCSATCQLEQNPPEPICGNGILETGEQCDDGNLINGDECSCLCKIEKEGEENSIKHGEAYTNEFIQYCEVNWKCSEWSECYKGEAKRKCTDMNNCVFSYNKPSETMACEQNVLVEEKGRDYSLFIGLGLTLFLLIVLVILLKRR